MIRTLIVENNLVIAELVADLLAATGYEVSGIARTVQEAVRLYHARHPDYAIVDIYLADDVLGSELVAQLGKVESVGILFASDNASGFLLTDEHGTAFITRPFRSSDLLAALSVTIDVHTKGSSSLPHPAGYRLLDASTA